VHLFRKRHHNSACTTIKAASRRTAIDRRAAAAVAPLPALPRMAVRPATHSCKMVANATDALWHNDKFPVHGWHGFCSGREHLFIVAGITGTR